MQENSSSLRHLTPILLFAMLVFSVVYVAPYVAQEIQFGITTGKLRAESAAAREKLVDPANRSRHSEMSGAFRLVTQSVGPSVVHINVEKALDSSTAPALTLLEGQPELHAQGDGSGVIVDSAGYILTNNHVVDKALEIRVKLSDGRRLTAELVGTDPLTDLAVLKIDAKGLVSTPWGDSLVMEVGDWVLALGSPYGLDRSVTAGIVSAKGRRKVVNDVPYQDFLQTDAAVNPGNSGGPLVNMNGELIGINTAILGRTNQGISFAIPSSIAKEVYERLKAGGRVRRAWLGVALQEIDQELAAKLKLADSKGALVTEVRPGNPAANAGLKPGDVILTWNQRPIADATELSFKVAATPIDSQVDVQVMRDGKLEHFRVTVTERPSTARP